MSYDGIVVESVIPRNKGSNYDALLNAFVASNDYWWTLDPKTYPSKTNFLADILERRINFRKLAIAVDVFDGKTINLRNLEPPEEVVAAVMVILRCDEEMERKVEMFESVLAEQDLIEYEADDECYKDEEEVKGSIN